MIPAQTYPADPRCSAIPLSTDSHAKSVFGQEPFVDLMPSFLSPLPQHFGDSVVVKLRALNEPMGTANPPRAARFENDCKLFMGKTPPCLVQKQFLCRRSLSAALDPDSHFTIVFCMKLSLKIFGLHSALSKFFPAEHFSSCPVPAENQLFSPEIAGLGGGPKLPVIKKVLGYKLDRCL